MSYSATTISEYFRLEGEKEGEKKGFIKGREEGREEGELKGEISILEVLYDEGLLSHVEFKTRITPLREKLAELMQSK